MKAEPPNKKKKVEHETVLQGFVFSFFSPATAMMEDGQDGLI